MLSVLIYGRNDTYGYNLHKRAAISINTFAAMLEQPGDEIIFVDYNTPDDFPTFPEAIRDTLTTRAREITRVLRVRPEQHRRWAGPHTLPVVEPLARNVGLRRSNQANRWILSTNTDVIIGLRGKGDLAALLASLPPGFYQAPRVEIPESIWEGFDRSDPTGVLATLADIAPRLHLDEIVYGNDSVLFDGPGDFQLCERATLMALDGFNASMDRGWHVDANLAVRLARHYGCISSLEDRLFAYHCDHTRQVTALHKPGSAQNSAEKFVDGVTRPDIPEQRDTWGAPDELVEEVRLDEGSHDQYVGALELALGNAQELIYRTGYRVDTFDSFDHDPRHVLPFLVDLISTSSKNLRLGWVGFRPEMQDRFTVAWRELGFIEPVRFWSGPASPGPDFDRWLRDCDMFVFDFGGSAPGKPVDRSQRSALGFALYAVRKDENARRAAGAAPRRIAGIDVVHNRFEQVFKATVLAAAAPFSTRIRTGFARTDGERVDWLALAVPTDQGWTSSAVGMVPGRHLLHLAAAPMQAELGKSALDLLVVRVRSGATEMAVWRGSVAHLLEDSVTLPFNVESRDCTLSVDVEGEASVITRIGRLWSGAKDSDFGPFDLCEAMIGNNRDWLPLLHIGKAGVRTDGGVAPLADVAGHAIFGPYWLLPPGEYVATLELDGGLTEVIKALKSFRPLPFFDARLTGGDLLARKFIVPSKSPQKVQLPFKIQAQHSAFPLELKVYSAGTSRFTLRRLTVDRR